MKPTLKILSLSAMVFFTTAVLAQDCHNFQKRKCDGSDNPEMNYNNQSKAGMFVMGHTSDLVFVAHSGKDYHISLCQDNKVEEPVKFQVLDGRSKELLYDSEQAGIDGGEGEEQGNPLSFAFSADVTKKIILRITAPGPPPEEGKGKNQKPNPEDLFCVGVLIEDMPTPALGF